MEDNLQRKTTVDGRRRLKEDNPFLETKVNEKKWIEDILRLCYGNGIIIMWPEILLFLSVSKVKMFDYLLVFNLILVVFALIVMWPDILLSLSVFHWPSMK